MDDGISINYVALPTLRRFHHSDARVRCVVGPVGCLPCETEVMTESGWVRIDAWGGERILQWDEATNSCRFIAPKRYVVGDCEDMLRFDCGRHMEMTLTANHRVPLYDWRGRFVVKTAAQVASKPSKHTVPTAWMGSGVVAMGDDELRLWVATAADGHYPARGNQCVFSFRKARKVERLERMLSRMGIDYEKVVYHRSDDGADETRIRFARIDLPKHLDWRLATCSAEQARIVVEEMAFWDGLYGYDYDRFNSTNRTDCDIVQYLSHCCGRNATLTECADGRNAEWKRGWCVHPARIGSSKNRVQLRCDSFRFDRVKPTDGRQYCFETDTGFFVVRQKDHIFITGNSGKSSAMIFGEPLIRAMKQSPDRYGLRKTRGVMIRNTYNELTTTTLKTFREWWGNAICTYRSDKPLSATIRFPMQDGTRVECEVIFLAMDKPDDIGKLRSLELTWGYINEASEIADYDILDALNERIGRYPKQWVGDDGKYTGGCDWCGIFIDTNAPDDEHWIYSKFEVERPDGFEVFHQPPAVLLAKGATPENPVWEPNKGQCDGIPPAENIEHLGRAGAGWDYYMKMIPGKDYDKVRVMLCGEYGTVAYGKPVFPNYKDQVYYMPNRKDPKTGRPRDVEVMRGLPIIIGYDPGFKFAAVELAQVSPTRQLRFFDEFVMEDTSTREFAQRLLMKMRNEYRNIPFFVRCDPAALQHGRTDARTDLDIFNECGLPTEPCTTNSPKERIESMMWFMNQLVDGEAGMVIGSKCQMLRKGMAGRYYYKKVSTSGRETLFKNEPVKNEYSHPCDAAQYVAASLLIDSNTRNAAMRATGTGFGSVFAEQTQQNVPLGIDGGGIY